MPEELALELPIEQAKTLKMSKAMKEMCLRT
jgi:hypothetical protein